MTFNLNTLDPLNGYNKVFKSATFADVNASSFYRTKIYQFIVHILKTFIDFFYSFIGSQNLYYIYIIKNLFIMIILLSLRWTKNYYFNLFSKFKSISIDFCNQYFLLNIYKSYNIRFKKIKNYFVKHGFNNKE